MALTKLTTKSITGDTLEAGDLAANSEDSSELVDGSIDTSHIGALQVTGAKLNTDVISAQTALGATPADTDELLVSDAGVLKRVDYSHLKGITAANFRPNANPFIINGNMQVAQRGTSVTGVTSGGYRTCDRFEMRMTGFGTWTVTQEALTAGEAFEDGFTTAFKLDNTTADASLGAGDYGRIHYAIEAQDCQQFKLGNSGSATFTLGFWVKATKTGTNVVAMVRTDADRMCCQSYTISSSNTWEYKVLNFPADTSGGVVNNDNGEGLEIDWWTGSGTTHTSGTLQTTWAAKVNANRAVGQVNHADSTSNNFHLTGVQLEMGTYTSSNMPPFQHESYGDNIFRCKRYCQSFGGSNAVHMMTAMCYSASDAISTLPFNPYMRSTASITTTASGGWSVLETGEGWSTMSTTSFDTMSNESGRIYLQGGSHTAGSAVALKINASNTVIADAEL